MKKIILTALILMVFTALLLQQESDGNSACKGMTWIVRQQVGDFVCVGHDRSTDPYKGDTTCDRELPILAIMETGAARPEIEGVRYDYYQGWCEGYLELTPPVKGSALSSLAEANRIIREHLGHGWRMAEHHDGGGGWSYWGIGNIPAGQRFWVYINDQRANPWNSTGSGSGDSQAGSMILDTSPPRLSYVPQEVSDSFIPKSQPKETAKHPLVDRIGHLKVGNPVVYKRMRIYPLLCEKAKITRDYLTLDRAVKKKLLIIKELEDEDVNEIEVKNKGDKPVILINGEIVKGANQDRMFQKDFVIPPKSKWIRVPVFCVEEGRWDGDSENFTTANLTGINTARVAGQQSGDSGGQSAVWSNISSNQFALNIVSKSGNVSDNYSDGKIKKRLARYEKKFKIIPQLSTAVVGAAVCYGSRVLCIEILGTNELLRGYWKKLLKSYVMEVLEYPEVKGKIDKRGAQEWIRGLSFMYYKTEKTPGTGSVTLLKSNKGSGIALTHTQDFLHLSFFPRNEL